MAESFIQEEAIFLAALEIAGAEERAAYLDAACGNQQELRCHVEALLGRHAQAEGPLDRPGLQRRVVLEQPGTERPGSVLGPYRLMEQIGEGGMGLVFVAEQQQPVRRKVALKVIKPGMDSRQVIARFEAERQALALMEHPNIARVLDAGTTPTGRPYFVMELVRGVCLTDYCDQQRLTTRQRLGLFLPVCQAVQHAHQKGIIHRDLKPSNVLVAVHDVTPIPKVIDFGIAKAMGQQLTDKTLYTAFAQLVGTPQYMSPEQAGLSSLDVDTRSDVYALGVLLYEMLTGSTPFDGASLLKANYDEMLRIIREDEPPRPSQRLSTLQMELLTTVSERRGTAPRTLHHELRGELDWIVMKALEKDRSRRYETASALAADVQRYLDDAPVEACPPAAGYRFRKVARRNKVALTTLLLVSTSLLLGTGVSIWQAVEARRARELAVERLANEQQAHSQAQASYQKALDAGERMLFQVAVEKLPGGLQQEKLRQRLREDAFAFYTDLIALNPNDAQAYVKRAKVFRNVRARADESRRDLEKAIALDPHNADAHEIMGAMLLAYPDVIPGTDTAKAFAYVERAVQLEPMQSTRHLFLGDMYRQADQVQNAMREYHRAAELLGPGSGQKCFCLARADFVGGNPRSALGHLAKCLALGSSDPWVHEAAGRIYCQIGLCHMALGEDEKALAAFDKGLDLPSYSAHRGSVYMTRADIYQNRKNDAAALEDYDRAIEVFPTFSNAYKRRAWSHFRLGHYTQALADLAKAIELKPHNESNLWWIPARAVATCPDEGFRNGMLTLADRTITLLHGKPASPQGSEANAYAIRGSIYAAMRQYDKARADFATAITLPTVNVWARHRHALFCLVTADKSAYRNACRETLHQYPQCDNLDTCWYCVWTCALAPGAVEDYAPVLELARWGTRTAPNSQAALLGLGAALFRAGQFQDAVNYLNLADRAPTLGPHIQRAYIWYILAMAEHTLGHTEQALSWYNKAALCAQDAATDHDLPWHREQALELLQKESKALLAVSDQPDPKDQTRDKPFPLSR